MFYLAGLIAAFALTILTQALRYDADQFAFNLNENQTATNPLDYWGEWRDHSFFPSPSNWRMPMYTLFLDRFVNGDPSNDNANGTQFEHDGLSNQLRNGGDVKGLQDTLDYIQGMGVRILYIAGSPMVNMPWGSHGYSPLDLSLSDRHHGTIAAWRDAISEIHHRGMYVVLDNTFATLGDLMGFEGYLNESTPFAAEEHDVIWKSERRYHDFFQSNEELDTCDYPRFWGDKGHQVNNLSHLLAGCRDSEFDQYGEVSSFGDYTEWQRQLSKFAFVQDRLREWRPSVLAKIQHFGCMTIASLDIDGFRIDKALQVTVDAQGAWSSHIRECAMRFNKTNFYIPGEIVAGNSFGAIYVGRGMEPKMATDNLMEVVGTHNASREYIRDSDHSALDAAAFHYTVYRALTRFLGMDGSYEAEGDPPVNFVETWNALLQTNDMCLVHYDSAISSLSIALGTDASGFDPDAPLPKDLPPTNASHTARAGVLRLAEEEQLTVRQLAQRYGGYTGLAFVRTPETIADEMATWLAEDACDGFTVTLPYLPQGLDDVTQRLVPELQRRELFRKEYEGTTLREHLGLPRPENRFFS
ncbi:hypothetical protein LTR29_017683 [Friedmanniomyces endolithicus]|nr:hypothetical protein LTR29_017683 [Friedmanniomyces endolithicus]